MKLHDIISEKKVVSKEGEMKIKKIKIRRQRNGHLNIKPNKKIRK
jgi:hypothetical protein